MSDALISHHAELKPQPRVPRTLDVVTPDADGTINCDVVIIGSGMGGSTFAHALRDSGLDIVIVERGDFLPREIQNWSAEAVFGQGRYRNAESWLDQANQAFSPGVFYYVGGNTKFYGAMLPRFREADFGEIQHAEGLSPAWPISYAEFEPWYAEAEKLANPASTPANPGAPVPIRNRPSPMTRPWFPWRNVCGCPGSPRS